MTKEKEPVSPDMRLKQIELILQKAKERGESGIIYQSELVEKEIILDCFSWFRFRLETLSKEIEYSTETRIDGMHEWIMVSRVLQKVEKLLSDLPSLDTKKEAKEKCQKEE